MILGDFKRYCEQNQPHVIIYNDENDAERTEVSHFESIRLDLIFDSVFIMLNPNTICFKGDCGTMCIDNVYSVSINGKCLIGDIVKVTARLGKRQSKYIFIFR